MANKLALEGRGLGWHINKFLRDFSLVNKDTDVLGYMAKEECMPDGTSFRADFFVVGDGDVVSCVVAAPRSAPASSTDDTGGGWGFFSFSVFVVDIIT